MNGEVLQRRVGVGVAANDITGASRGQHSTAFYGTKGEAGTRIVEPNDADFAKNPAYMAC
jgi:hypothetical protein